ncbi:hypothetical protein PoB_004347700 [Plakobranchus ocellatus]|uniref:Uncharacterized protein n=1 Tax=Plakobranchus ocellatus TaxID=259542 RepID=A0AAV4BC10_9GAST|nr:hypothetical protein PoB_004347700 [Plakobranchus ocellatus]
MALCMLFSAPASFGEAPLASTRGKGICKLQEESRARSIIKKQDQGMRPVSLLWYTLVSLLDEQQARQEVISGFEAIVKQGVSDASNLTRDSEICADLRAASLVTVPSSPLADTLQCNR